MDSILKGMDFAVSHRALLASRVAQGLFWKVTSIPEEGRRNIRRLVAFVLLYVSPERIYISVTMKYALGFVRCWNIGGILTLVAFCSWPLWYCV